MNDNVMLMTDCYKMFHCEQYPEDTEYIYSYLEARKEGEIIFFGLQYLLKEYLSKPILPHHAEELIYVYMGMMGQCPEDTKAKFRGLAELGYWPVKIKAVPEGTVISNKNVLLTITNTHPDFAWCVGFLESFLLKLWNPCTVAACSRKYKKLVTKYAEETCDNLDHIPYSVHDFGYRGVSSEETAAISGAAHLISFLGSDTIPAVAFLNRYYLTANQNPSFVAASVPASEHSVMCSYGREGEWEALDRMLDLYPTGIVSIVSDTYNLWDVLTKWAPSRKERILSRDGKVVFRPDSGKPVDIVCGLDGGGLYPWLGRDGVTAYINTPSIEAQKGCLKLLEETFGSTLNDKGYKILNPKVGLIYGDGMHYDRFELMLHTMECDGWASSNLVIGVGGLLLQQHNRDEFGFAIKATRIVRGGKEIEIYKDPITDPGKKSKKGLMCLVKTNGEFKTKDQVDEFDETSGALKLVFEDGKIIKEFSLEEVRENATR